MPSSGKRIWALTGGWIVCSTLMLLAPSPREWGPLGDVLSPVYDDIQPFLQPLAHFIFMTVFSFLLAHMLSNMPMGAVMIYAFGVTMLLAAVLELLQSFLPPWFARTCDLADLTPALFGSCIGSVSGAVSSCRPWRKTPS